MNRINSIYSLNGRLPRSAGSRAGVTGRRDAGGSTRRRAQCSTFQGVVTVAPVESQIRQATQALVQFDLAEVGGNQA